VPIVLRCLEQLSDFGGKQIVFALLVVQEVAEAPLGETESIPRSDVEIADAYFPCSFEGALGFLVGMLVELVSEGHAGQSETKLLLVDLLRAVRHGIGTVVVSVWRERWGPRAVPRLQARRDTDA
jgi:hypothetical protein